MWYVFQKVKDSASALIMVICILQKLERNNCPCSSPVGSRAQDCVPGPIHTDHSSTPLQWTWTWAMQLPCPHSSPQSRQGMPMSPGKCLIFCRWSLTSGAVVCDPSQGPLTQFSPSGTLIHERMVGSLEDGCPQRHSPDKILLSYEVSGNGGVFQKHQGY